ncbi:hypothetical protein GCM10010404_87930 [Nonomuraea africana]|uniref:Transposase (putative) YhgA-like domain-containing protein n=1 Tax=Nonomuraea africana TaxID=46171 RepID=A0ABR9KK97_9ACTN|nr:hypothetical protein [Nonomuraea africana]MBE1562245.1 hypothetical protein [Nonomuraea africana]
MASLYHEALHRIFQEDTSLVARAFDRLLGAAIPEPRKISVVDSDLNECKAIVRRGDTLLLVEADPDRYVVIVESQTETADDKPLAWAYYLSHAAAKYDALPALLVISRSRSTAGWSRQFHRLGLPGLPSLIVCPLVLGPDNVPVITDLAEACQDVSLTILTALIHACDSEVGGILNVLAPALSTIDPDIAKDLAEFTEAGLQGTPAQALWRALMSAMTFPYQSELRSLGHEEGRADEAARMVLRVLERRGVAVSDQVRDRVLDCTDSAALERWFDRALEATTADEIFD